MCAHVRGNGRTLRKPPVADRTSKRFFPAVRPHVRSQVRSLRKRFIAVDAPVGLFAAVGTQVGLEGARPCVTFT